MFVLVDLLQQIFGYVLNYSNYMYIVYNISYVFVV